MFTRFFQRTKTIAMKKYMTFFILIIGLGTFLYYTTEYEVEAIKLEHQKNSYDEIVFNPFPVNHSFPTSKPEASKDKNYFNNGVLDWQNLGIPAIPDSFFYYYPFIKVLNLQKNELEEIPRSIRFLKDLKKLNVANNQLKTLPEDNFLYKQFPKIHELDLTSNQISEFPLKLLIVSSQLKRLILDFNQIKTLPNSLLYNVLYNDALIEEIHLNANQIQEFPSLFNRFQYLKSLELKSNQIQGRVNLINFKHLNYLNLEHNYITEFTSDKNSSNVLRTLNIEENQLRYFEDQKVVYHKLRLLYLDDNRLKKLTLTESVFPKLEVIRINDNELEEFIIPSPLPLLETLSINDNNIKNFPSLENLPNLTELDISGNQLTEMPKGIFTMDSLETLRCSNNNISGSLKWENSNIERLFLYKNQIEKVELKNNPELWHINLDRNNLKSFSIDQITLNALRYLSIDGNSKLADISIEYILKNAPNLQSFTLSTVGISSDENKKYQKIAKENNIHFWYSGQVWDEENISY